MVHDELLDRLAARRKFQSEFIEVEGLFKLLDIPRYPFAICFRVRQSTAG